MTLCLVSFATHGKDYLTTNLKEFLTSFLSINPTEDTSQSLCTRQIYFFSFWTAMMQAKITITYEYSDNLKSDRTTFKQIFVGINQEACCYKIERSILMEIMLSVNGDNILKMNHKCMVIVLVLLFFAAKGDVNAVNPICSVCHAIVGEYQRSIPRRPTELVLDIIATTYCTKKKLQNHNVCKGAVNEMMDSIVNSLWRHYTDPHAVCHNLRMCPKEYKVRNMDEEIKTILTGKPDKEWEKPTNRKVIKALHISDLHPDLYYTAGAAAKCSEPVCCRSNVTMKMSLKDILNKIQNGEHLQVKEENAGNEAGYWGSLNSCDLPIQSFQLFLKEVSAINPDLIIWTGDNTPHDVWQQSQSYNLNFTVMLSEKMRKATKARVIGAMGNHQSFPVNVYDYEGDREKMLVGGLAEAWKPWLTQEAYDMLRTKGYFSITIPEFNNLKIISVNTQAQNGDNWFNLRNPTDPGQMLKWIESELKASEQANQFVYIIGHIPPASAMNDWAMRFNALTERYSYNIRGQFYGHTHRDHVGFFPSFADHSKISAYYLISPSLTTYSNKHPEYRVMTLDYDTLQVIDYEQYRLDLTKYKNKEDDAKFELFYRFKEAYNIPDMTIKGGMTQLQQKLMTDNETQIKYTYLKSSGTEKGHAGKDVYCDTMPSPQWGTECNGGTYKPSSFEKIAGKWKDLQHKE